jgi:hypothetical protein
LIIPTTQVTTGNVYTVNDQVANSAVPPIPPGSIWFTKDVAGNCVEYQYVRLASSNTSGNNWAPGSPLYYRDFTRTVVSDFANDSATFVSGTCAFVSSFAGVLLNQSAVNGGNNANANDSYVIIIKNGVIPIQTGNAQVGNANSVSQLMAAGNFGALAASNTSMGYQDQWITSNASFPPIGVANNSAPLVAFITAISATQAFLVGPII